MRVLKRNQKTIYYKNFISEAPIVDSNNNETGEYEKTYSPVIETKANVTESSGSAYHEMFGIHRDYDKIITLDKTDMTEESILWIDQSDTSKPHDYIVKRISKSLNSVVVEVSRVE